MIDVKQLRFAYPATHKAHPVPALNDISFKIEEGEIFGFLGPSGSGKSTTQQILCGLLTGFEGDVIVHGKTLQQWGREYYRHIGVGFELPNHYNALSAKENLELFAAFYNVNVDRGLELLEELGLSSAINKRVSAFSKGMKMRLNFARCLMHKPRIIFLDEPTSGLDPNNARVIKRLINEERKKGHSIFLSTHAMHDADELCDRIALLNQGRIVASDTPEQLKGRYGSPNVLVQFRESSSEGSNLHEQLFLMNELGTNTQFQKLADEKHIETIHSQEASLEDVFVALTGKGLV